MRKGQNYVVQCHTGVSRRKVLLGSRGRYQPGDLVTEDGTPTRDPNEAAIYVHDGDEEFPFEDVYDWGTLRDYFKPVPVTISVRLSR